MVYRLILLVILILLLQGRWVTFAPVECVDICNKGFVLQSAEQQKSFCSLKCVLFTTIFSPTAFGDSTLPVALRLENEDDKQLSWQNLGKQRYRV